MNVDATISSREATFALPSETRGPMNVTPHSLSLAMLAETAGLVYMESCMAGAMATGMPDPRATVAKDVTGVSSMPLASLDTVFAVAG